MTVTDEAVERASFALFAANVATFDIPEPAARLEWDMDPELRGFWRGQVHVVLEAIGGTASTS